MLTTHGRGAARRVGPTLTTLSLLVVAALSIGDAAAG
jgi:hypothetical protein